MATGKTNARYIKVSIDDIGDSARDISASVSDVSGVGLDFATQDVTAYSDGVINFTLGHPSAEIDISGPLNNTATTGGHTIFAAMIDAPYSQDSYTLTVQIGIRATPTTGDPEFEGAFERMCEKYPRERQYKSAKSRVIHIIPQRVAYRKKPAH